MAGYPLQITIGATLAGTLGSAVRGAQAQLGQLGSTLSGLSQQESGVGRLQGLRGQTAQAAQAMRAAQARVRTAQAAVANAGDAGPTATQARELQRATTAADRATEAYRRQRTAVDQLSDSLREAGVDTRNLGNEQQRIGSQLERVRTRTEALTRATQAQQRNMENRGAYRTQMMDAAALGMALGAPIRAAANFEQAMANVGAVARASDEDLGKLTRQARELGAATNWTASQAAEGMKYLAMAGFSAEQTMAAMPGMLNLASAGAIELGEAADIASNILTGFNLEAGQMSRVGDILTATFTSSNTTLQSLGYTMKYVAPIAASTGTTIETVAAMAGKLGDAGIQGEMAGTALRAMLTRLAAPTDKAAGVLNELGVATKDADGNLRPMVAVLKELDASMADLGSADKANAVATLFGVEAASAATVLMAQAASGAIDDMAEAITREGTAAEVAAKQNATTIGALKRLGSAVESMAISIGSVLLPPLAQLADKLAPIISGVSAWAEANPKLTTALVGTVAGAIALKVAAIGLGYAFTFIKGPILAARTAIAMVRAQMALISVGAASGAGPLTLLGAAFGRAAAGARAFALALIANPVGLTIAAIGVAVAGLALVIRKYWEPLSAFVSGVFEGIASAIQPALTGISAAFEPIKTAFAPLGPIFDAIGSALGRVVGWFGSLLSPVQLSGSEFEAMASKGEALGAVVGGVLNAGLQLIIGPLNLIGQAVQLAAQGFTAFGQFAQQAWTTITTTFQNNAPLEAIRQLASQLLGALSGLPGQFLEIGSQIIGGLISGIKAKIGSAVAAAREAVSGVIDGAKAKLGIKSPSRVFAAIGEQVNAGMAQGLMRSRETALQPVLGLAERMGAVAFGLPAVQGPNTPFSPDLTTAPAMRPGTAWPAPVPPAMPDWGEPPAPSVMPQWGQPPEPPAMPGWEAPPALPTMPAWPQPPQPPAWPPLPRIAPVFERLSGVLSKAMAPLLVPALAVAAPAPVPVPVAPAAPLGASLPAVQIPAARPAKPTPTTPSEAARPALEAQPIPATVSSMATTPASTGPGSIHFAPTINITAGANQESPEDLAQLIEHRLRVMFRDTLRGTAASLFD
ncbi:phage tail tape measure protein [Lamprobacter modestohalophilus]|uniref:phage tail tape measure protein n=1 Tax=Lamprobacter modestohalophilus TaxID=1064514 RepID=UPI002ADEEA99|nr:phage tail tape measure protein [Lamprobacter modestohalophilus]MEA1053388.1 phage tail tape measure protein [Lamprobacter modestohalophilus]